VKASTVTARPAHARLLRLGLRLALGLTALVLIWSCNAPFIPVPPPAQAGFTAMEVADGNGGLKTVWITTGKVSTDADRVFVFNQVAGSGVITRADVDGNYRAPPIDGAR
jgi:hypothetical protein